MAEQRGDERLDQGPTSAGAFQGDHSAGHQGDIDWERQGGGPPGAAPEEHPGTTGAPPRDAAPSEAVAGHASATPIDQIAPARDTAGDMGTGAGGTTRSGLESAHPGMAASDVTTGLAGAVERGDRR